MNFLSKFRRRIRGAVNPESACQLLEAIIEHARENRALPLLDSMLGSDGNLLAHWRRELAAEVADALSAEDPAVQKQALRALALQKVASANDGWRVLNDSRLSEAARVHGRKVHSALSTSRAMKQFVAARRSSRATAPITDEDVRVAQRLALLAGGVAQLGATLIESIFLHYYSERMLPHTLEFLMETADLRALLQLGARGELAAVSSKGDGRRSPAVGLRVLVGKYLEALESQVLGTMSSRVALAAPARAIEVDVKEWGQCFRRAAAHSTVPVPMDRVGAVLWAGVDAIFRGDGFGWFTPDQRVDASDVLAADVASVFFYARLLHLDVRLGRDLRPLLAYLGDLAVGRDSLVDIISDSRPGESAQLSPESSGVLDLQMWFACLDAHFEAHSKDVLILASALEDVAGVPSFDVCSKLRVFVRAKYVATARLARTQDGNPGGGQLCADWCSGFERFLERERGLMNSLTSVMRA